MSESIWQREECGHGRKYMLGKEPYIKYDDQESIVAAIVDGLKEFVHAEPAVRITLDSPSTNPERIIIAIPFETDEELFVNNFANVIYQSMIGYYISAEPQTTHFGIANLILEGKFNSLLRREMEKLINQFQNRNDMAGRLIQNVKLTGKMQAPEPGSTYLVDTIKKGLDIHIGYRIYAMGHNVNYTKIFLPLETGKEIIDLIYYNLEQIIHQNFVAYDETGDRYLKITESLVFRELERVMDRAKTKELTRKKIINNLQFNTMLVDAPETADSSLLGDKVYDYFNQIQDTKLREITERSRELYTIHAKETSVTLQQHPRAIEEIEKEEEEKSGGPVHADYGSLFAAREQARRKQSGKPRTTIPSRRPVQVPKPPERGSRVPSPEPAARTPSRET